MSPHTDQDEINGFGKELGIIFENVRDLNYKFQFSKALKKFEDIKHLMHTSSDPFLKADLHFEMGVTYYYLKEYDLATLEFQKSYNLYGKKKKLDNICEIIVYFGMISLYEGNFEDAIGYFNVPLSINSDNSIATVRATTGLGTIALWNGELSKAMKYFDEGLILLKSLSDARANDFAKIYITQGVTHLQQGNFVKSKDCFDAVLAFDPGHLIEFNIAAALFYSSIIAIEQRDEDRISEYKKLFENVKSSTSDELIKRGAVYIQAKYFLSKERLHDKFKAQELLEQITSGDIIYHSLHVLALKDLCQILLIEYNSTENDAVFREIEEIIERILIIAKKQQSMQLLVEINIFRSRLLLASSQVDEALELIDYLEDLAETLNLKFLGEVIQKERINLQKLINKWEKFGLESATIRDKLFESRVFDYLKAIQGISIP